MTSSLIILGLHQVFLIEISEKKPLVFRRTVDFLPNFPLFDLYLQN